MTVPPVDLSSAVDELLAVRCQLGEPAAFDELIARWQGPLWGFVRRFVPHDDAAGDVLQDVWVRVLRGLPGLRDPSRLRSWIFGIARRTLMDRLRRQYADAVVADIDADGIAAGPATVDADELAALDRAVERLPLLEREAVTLFYLQELSLVEIADVLKIPIGTAKSRLFRGRVLLRQQLIQEG